MSDAQKYDTNKLDMLRRDLKDLRGKARDEGVLKAKNKGEVGGSGGVVARRFAAMRAPEHSDKGKQVATRILAMLRGSERDSSPVVPGTTFTEDGVATLLDKLSSPPKALRAAPPMLHKLHQFLTAETPNATMIAGANVERLKVISKLLPQVEQHGWDHVQSLMSQRREQNAGAGEADPDEGYLEPPAAPARRPGAAARRART